MNSKKEKHFVPRVCFSRKSNASDIAPKPSEELDYLTCVFWEGEEKKEAHKRVMESSMRLKEQYVTSFVLMLRFRTRQQEVKRTGNENDLKFLAPTRAKSQNCVYLYCVTVSPVVLAQQVMLEE